ncbi:uncharacterized protein J3D65DRAFT_615901 [Phyllosticta citribraziliensis]|uniref:Uncharacterized protein n=1 Tax=Phyllosticta citribraziliensis TaxID=989973 RepID=A0ABR1LZJ5_9PEZI
MLHKQYLYNNASKIAATRVSRFVLSQLHDHSKRNQYSWHCLHSPLMAASTKPLASLSSAIFPAAPPSPLNNSCNAIKSFALVRSASSSNAALVLAPAVSPCCCCDLEIASDGFVTAAIDGAGNGYVVVVEAETRARAAGASYLARGLSVNSLSISGRWVVNMQGGMHSVQERRDRRRRGACRGRTEFQQFALSLKDLESGSKGEGTLRGDYGTVLRA